VLLVGHSYGGAVITNVDRSAGDIVGLVYVCGFAPDAGESCATLSVPRPGGTLGETLTMVELAGSQTDLYIARTGTTSSSAPTCPPRWRRGWP
jgi:pimeloyl-ACP methyl ester carboxylesterase